MSLLPFRFGLNFDTPVLRPKSIIMGVSFCAGPIERSDVGSHVGCIHTWTEAAIGRLLWSLQTPPGSVQSTAIQVSGYL